MNAHSPLSPQPLSDAPPPYGTIVFDCDSTLASIEGIEELMGDDPTIAALTKAAMEGEVPLEAVFEKRLAIARPSSQDMRRVAVEYRAHAVHNARELIAALRSLGKQVAIVSGGLAPAVRPFGQWLGVDLQQIYAVDLFFDSRGAYAGFEHDSPLARSGGKIALLKDLAGAEGAGALALIGDGATDLEAAPLADRFIAYCGVKRRPAVVRAALVRCDSADFLALAPLLLSPAEREQVGFGCDHP